MIQTPDDSRPVTIEHFSVLVALVQGAEELRWTRLNTLLLTDSILLGGWFLLATAGATPGKDALLTISCVPAIAMGLLFGFLGKRTSAYVDAYLEIASRIEVDVFQNTDRPFASTSSYRDPRGLKKITYSKWLVTLIPFGSAALFMVLASWPYWPK